MELLDYALEQVEKEITYYTELIIKEQSLIIFFKQLENLSGYEKEVLINLEISNINNREELDQLMDHRARLLRSKES